MIATHNSVTLKTGAGNAVVLPAPIPGYPITSERAQVQADMADGATRYVYDKAVVKRRIEPTFLLTNTERGNLATWFHTYAVAGQTTFTYWDHLGNKFTSTRLDTPRLDFTKETNGKYRVTLPMLLTAEGQ